MNVKSSAKLSSLLISTIIGVGLLIPSLSLAQTTAELIASLQAQIASLTEQIRQLQTNPGNQTRWCYAFNKNLGIGSRGSDVSALQHALNLELGIQIEETGYFGVLTKAAVAKWQYANGITPAVGYFGLSTRNKLNQLYECGIILPPPVNTQTPVISGVKGPTTLNVGETGTWSVSAYDPENGSLSYSVIWGDEPQTSAGGVSGSPMSQNFDSTQTATFTHFYANAGVYTPVFYVTDNQGLSAKTSISVNVGNTQTNLGSLSINSPDGTYSPFKLDVNKSMTLQAFYQPPMPPCLSGFACAQMMPALYPVEAKWVVANPSIAGVSYQAPTTALVTGLLAGNTEVKAMYTDSSGNLLTATADVRVLSPAQSSITVLSPNGGESWQSGSRQTITWQPYRISTGDALPPVGWVTITLDSGLRCFTTPCPSVYTLANNIADNGFFDWIVGKDINGNSIPNGDYRVIVTFNSYPPFSDTSDAPFSIVATVPIPTPTPTPTPIILPQSQQSGWNYNLTKHCVKSTNPSGANYYQDLTDCGTQGKNWTVAVESEKTLGASFPGPANQSFPINDPNSPVKMNWVKHTDELGRQNYSINLKTDFSGATHPGGPGYFTWFVLMDHVGHNGGPLPRPDQLTFSATASYNDFVPNGSSRGLAGWQGWWDGRAHSIEINFASKGWGDAHPDPDIVNVINTSTLQFVDMDGAAMGITIPRTQDTLLKIDWSKIIKNLVSRGLLDAPSGGWANTATQAVFIGTEVKNDTASNSVISDLWFTNFRVEDTSVLGTALAPNSPQTASILMALQEVLNKLSNLLQNQ